LGVRASLTGKRGWRVCGEATNGMEAVAKTLELKPDVIILDVSMVGMNGFEAATEIRLFAKSTKIIFFSMHDVQASARAVGGDAFVTKTQPVKELIAAIERVTSNLPS
jgi:DNA-binding NarL/FixJ family response regulator